MSRVISLGLEAMGTGRSVRLDEEYQNELKQLLKDALKRGTEHEKTHAKAVHMFANELVLTCSIPVPEFPNPYSKMAWKARVDTSVLHLGGGGGSVPYYIQRVAKVRYFSK